MRLLHTSDWHVGKPIRGRSRADEHRAVLAEVAAVAESQQVDLVLVTGDLFDTASPTPEAEGIAYRALLDLAGTGAQVVVVSGNHDNPRRLEAVAPLLGLAGVTVRHTLVPAASGGVVTIASRDGTESATVALVPFVSQRHIVKADDLMGFDGSVHGLQYADRVQRAVAALAASFRPDTVNVIAAHLMALGGQSGGGERKSQTIFDYAVNGAAFPADAHYVALGHLHRPQRIGGPCPIWYAGSPLQLDFGETADESAVLVVEATPGTPAVVRHVALTAGRRLRTVTGTLAVLAEQVGTTGDDHVRIVVEERPRPGLADEVRELFPDCVEVAVRPPDMDDGAGAGGGPVKAARLGRSPQELFGEYLADRGEVDDRLLALFAELLDEAEAPDAA